MRILAFSDLHRDLDRAAELVRESADVDAVIAAGDFASQHRGLEETVEALAGIECPSFLVPGNNETEEALRAACAAWPAATVLHGTGASLDGIDIFGLGAGVPVTPWDWSFDLSEEEAERRLEGCPDGGVLVLHSPPRGHVDRSATGEHLGSRALLRAIEEHRPRLAVCGHIHDSWGERSRIGDTPVLNLGPRGAVLEVEA